MPRNRKDDEDDHKNDKNPPSQSILLLLEESIAKFTGTDKTYSITKWSQDVEDNAEIFGLTPTQTLLVARRSLAGSAALWLRSEKPFATYDSLKTALTNEFPDVINVKEIHELMSKRRLQKNETCYEYMLHMKELGKRGRLPDNVSIQYIIDGITDYESNKIILYGATTYPELKEKLKIYEKIKRKVEKPKSESTDKITADKTFVKKTARCYNCGDVNHTSNDCPHREKGLKCFRCNEFGHIGAKCTANSFATSTASRISKASQNHNGRPSTSTSTSHAHSHAHTSRRSMCVKLVPNQDGDNQSQSEEVHDCANLQDGGETSNPTSSIFNADVNKHKIDTKKPIKSIKIQEKCTTALIDSGSDLNLITVSCFNAIKSKNYDTEDVQFSGLGGKTVSSLGKWSGIVEIDENCYQTIMHIVPDDVMPYDVIIGQELLKDVTFVSTNGKVTIKPDIDDWINHIQYCNTVVDYISDQNIRNDVENLIQSYKPGKTKEAPIQLKIILKDDKPVAFRPRRLAIKEQIEVDQQVKEWLKEGIIRPSTSDYAAPVVPVKKKDGTIRVCVDYRSINEKMVKDEYPLPLIETQIDQLSKAKVFSKLDLKNGFFHLKVHDDSIKYTSFVTSSGQYEFLRAPFGLSNCPKVFMRFVNIIFRELIEKGIVMIFIDDIIIPAENEKQALERLQEVLKVAAEYGLNINWKKTQLLSRKIEYLGHVIENGNVHPSAEKTDAVLKYPQPKTLKQLQRFLGLTSYFRKYIPDYSKIAAPLSDLLKKNKDFTFDEKQISAFNSLKRIMASEPVLKIYDPDLETELHTDASLEAISAILLQRNREDGQLHPVYYMSRKTTDAQRKYTSYELEALAIIEGIKKFRPYLYGIKFKIVTDCSAFEMTLKKKDLNTRVARWVLFLQDYSYTIEHRPGDKMKHTDALSRAPYVAVITPIRDSIIKAQETDDKLLAIMEVIKSQKTYQDYLMMNGALYKGEEQQLVIPRKMEQEIIKRAHENGHFGKKKTTELISKDYYIENLTKKVENYIMNCIPCILANRKEGKQEGYLNPIPKEDLPLQTLHLDHIGPFTETKKMYNYILTIIDAFTKFTWLFPVKSTTSKETLMKMQVHQQTFGNPARVVTDKGTAFTAHDFEDYCKDENIKHVTITTGIARGNGQVERIHRVIKSVLAKLCIQNPDQWYKHVSQLQRALNSTYQRSINTSPFELMIGAKMKMKEDIEIFNTLLQENRDSYMEEREKMRQEAKIQILKVQEENKKTYNRKRKESQKYKVGDLVAVKRTQYGTHQKLKPLYLGPYKVSEVKGNDRYSVEKVNRTDEGPIKTSSAADFMKPWATSTSNDLD